MATDTIPSKRKSRTPEPAASPIDAAIETVTLSRQSEARERADADAVALATYAAALSAEAEGRAPDAEGLAGAIARLGVTPERLAEDRLIASRAVELHRLHSDKAAASVRRVEAYQARRDVEAKYEADLAAAHKACYRADESTAKSSAARGELLRLAKQRRELFDLSTDPPTLRR